MELLASYKKWILQCFAQCYDLVAWKLDYNMVWRTSLLIKGISTD